MFTKLQTNKFSYLFTHEKYGEIARSAFNSWNSGASILFLNFGFNLKKIKNKPELIVSGKQLCLIAASILNEKTSEKKIKHSDLLNIAIKKFKISREELWALISGFDDNGLYKSENIEAYNFGRDVRLLVKKRKILKK